MVKLDSYFSMPQKPEVLSIGSLVIDVINGENKIGGASANVAVDLQMLGSRSSLLTALSHEKISVEYKSHLESLGIPVHGLGGSLEQLPRCVIRMGDDGKEIDYDWFGNGVEELFQFSEIDAALITEFPLIYLAICEHIYASKVARGINDSQILAYNPGSRTLEDHAFFKQIQQRADYIFLNEGEYGHLVANGFIQNPQELIVRTNQVAVITAGNKETTLVSENETIKVEPELVRAVDETGAGDSFASAFIWARIQGYPFERCLRIGNLLASFVVRQVGCQVDSDTVRMFKTEAKNRDLLN